MLNLLSEHYKLKSSSLRFVPLDIAVIAPDYYLYLFDAGDTGYVVVETDYLSGMPGIVKDIETAFPDARVTGWCVRQGRQTDDAALLPRESDDYDPDGTNDTNHNNYHDAVIQQNGWRYAVLEVTFY